MFFYPITLISLCSIMTPRIAASHLHDHKTMPTITAHLIVPSRDEFLWKEGTYLNREAKNNTVLLVRLL